MKKTSGKLAVSLRAVAISLALAGSGAMLVSASASYAQTAATVVLTAEQTAALGDSLKSAITAAQGDSAAIAQAIVNSLTTAVATYGSGAAGSITSAIIDICEAAGISASVIGNAIAQAAAILSTTDTAAASAVASMVASEGNADEITAFATEATALGYANLALLANGPPVAALPGTPSSKGAPALFGSTSGSGGGTAGCLNPSCTSL